MSSKIILPVIIGIIFLGSFGFTQDVFGETITFTEDTSIVEDTIIASGETWTINSGVTLTIDSGVTFTNNGKIDNNGTIINDGTFNNGAYLDRALLPLWLFMNRIYY